MNYRTGHLSFATFAVLILSFSTLTCSSGMIMPGKGITESFYRKVDGQIVPVGDYDFSRLGQGYGICVFGFEYRGMKGNKITGFRDQTDKGMRVWEYHFRSDDWEVKWLEERMKVWGFPTIRTLFLTKAGYNVTVHLPFHRGRIVYAGRLVVDWNTYLNEGPNVEFHFEDDMGPWLEQLSTLVESIKIDTALMRAGF